MTKVRPPLSINAALDRIAGLVEGGWLAMGDAIGKAERTVRNYGDPDTPEEISARDAITLDILFQQNGGEGAPIFQTYALQLEIDRADVFATQAEIARRVQISIVEGAEAAQAAIACALPGATDADFATAIREQVDAISANTDTLAALKKGAGSFGDGARVAPGEGGA
ncbi:hypothetical protein K9B35_14385 [Sphingomonas sp. R647]|uniref:hypothetical protein n=1 Tax=Sphingomonas sp. R647 TaxID=2875233 RepID=UPI001CD2713B|nr:hypothetical protein [Sphingomonas sp. R647]MCA1199162.1 hypothetical protein [Sphingomonas sp. R647]